MKTVIEMAREAGFWREHINTWMGSSEDLRRLEALVRADEREACAKVCDDFAPSQRDFDRRFYDGCESAAAAIRARGNK